MGLTVTVRPIAAFSPGEGVRRGHSHERIPGPKLMRKPRSFLLVCDDEERLYLLIEIAQRIFPGSVLQTCADLETALDAARAGSLDAIFACRAADASEPRLMAELREAGPAPVISLCGIPAKKCRREFLRRCVELPLPPR